MKFVPSRDWILLALVGVTAVIGLVTFIAGDSVPVIGEPLHDLAADFSPSQIGGWIAVLIFLTVIIQLFNNALPSTNRSSIISSTPEYPEETEVPEVTTSFTTIYMGVNEWFDEPRRPVRMVAMYGRRGLDSDEYTPEEIEKFLDELTITARDAYITKTSCDIKTATDAVATGEWTENRRAAAFLASELDADPEFTKVERLRAWMRPREEMQKRVNDVLRAIEDCSDVYLTFDGKKERGNTDLSSGVRSGVEK